jgi:hypothetical protein
MSVQRQAQLVVDWQAEQQVSTLTSRLPLHLSPEALTSQKV